VNGQPIGLKILRLLTSSLLTTVDAAAASTALNRPTSRLSLLDFGLSETIKRNFLDAKRHYLSLRRKRQQIQDELTQRQRALPSYDDEINTSVMNSWIQEFYDFQQRMDKLRIRASTLPHGPNSEGTTALHLAFHKLSKSKWCDYVPATSFLREKKENPSFESERNDFYSCLLTVHNELKLLEGQLAKSRQAHDALVSLSSSSISAISATERVRKILIDMANNNNDPNEEDPIFASVEKTHDLLNTVEYAIRKCAQSIDNNDSDDSIVAKLEVIKRTAPISLDEMEQHVASWNSLARKHGVSPYNLVSCQTVLMEQYEGNVEAKVKLLPAAIAEEGKAKGTYQTCYSKLHEARLALSSRVSDKVTELLPHLGMNGCKFTMELQKENKDPESTYADKLNFALSYGLSSMGSNVEHRLGRAGSASEFIASSGEKARILLAMETILPGSIGACCRKSQVDDSLDFDELTLRNGDGALLQNLVAPIAVMYDEIDAHVGGQAVVALAKMLFEQSRSSGQIISITHSASVAAFADQHLVINRAQLKDSNRMGITIMDVSGEERRKELARMTSGDMAAEEASRFAEALLREREKYISRVVRQEITGFN
jgi:DNA repair ATPase RecN